MENSKRKHNQSMTSHSPSLDLSSPQPWSADSINPSSNTTLKNYETAKQFFWLSFEVIIQLKTYVFQLLTCVLWRKILESGIWLIGVRTLASDACIPYWSAWAQVGSTSNLLPAKAHPRDNRWWVTVLSWETSIAFWAPKALGSKSNLKSTRFKNTKSLLFSLQCIFWRNLEFYRFACWWLDVQTQVWALGQRGT